MAQPISPWPYVPQEVTQQAGRPWNIDQVAAPSFWMKTKGGGAVVAVIDTGLDVSHPEFKGRVFKPQDLTGGGSIADREGHGTHVAGIIAGATCGVAPEARIMPLKVFPDDPSNPNVGLYIQDALRWIWEYNKTASEADKVVAVNCSWGGGTYDTLMAWLIRALVLQGVTVVVAAGNQGDGDPETHEAFSYPAYIWECLTVGAVNKDGTGAIYSNSFDGIDLAAPGTEIYSAWPGGGYKLLSGTSMAAPHVTGAMALVCDAWRDREGSWPTEEQAVGVLLKHVRKVKIDPVFVGEGLLDLTWQSTRWPLHRVQLGAFYNESGAKTTEDKARALGLNTYRVKY